MIAEKAAGRAQVKKKRKAPAQREASGQEKGTCKEEKAPAKKGLNQESGGKLMGKENFERHKQPWNGDEAGKLRLLASKGQGLKQIAKALNRSEESTRDFRQEEQDCGG